MIYYCWLESGQPGTGLLSYTLFHQENTQLKTKLWVLPLPPQAVGPVLQLSATKRTKQNGKTNPLLREGIPLAIKEKLSKAAPSPWPASLKPPPCQHPPSHSSRAGPLCGENTHGEERRAPRERERGETGAEGTRRKEGETRAEGGRRKGGETGAGGAASKGGEKGAEGDRSQGGSQAMRGQEESG